MILAVILATLMPVVIGVWFVVMVVRQSKRHARRMEKLRRELAQNAREWPIRERQRQREAFARKLGL